MLRVESLELNNFKKYKNRKFKFEDKGFTLISGPNESGKSTIPDALCWLLYNRLPRGGPISEIVNWHTGKDCWVRGTITIDKNKLEIFRYRAYGGKNNHGVEIWLNDKEIKGESFNLNDFIVNTIHIDFDEFLLYVLFSNGIVQYFARSKPAERYAILETILQMEEVSKAYERCTKELGELTTEYTSTDKELDHLSERVEEIDEEIKSEEKIYEEKKAQLEAWEEVHARRIKEQNETITTLQQKIDKLEEPDLEDDTDKGLVKYEAEIEKLNKKLGKLSAEISMQRKIRDKPKPKLVDLLGTNCPTCGKPITEDDTEHLESAWKEETEEAGKEIIKLEQKKTEVDENWQRVVNKVEDLNEKKRKNEKLANKYEAEKNALEAGIKGAKEILHHIEEESKPTDVKDSQDRLTNLEKKKLKVESKLENAKKEMEKIEHKIHVQKTAQLLLSKNGPRKTFLQECGPHLAYETNRYLNVLTEGAMSVRIEVAEKTNKVEVKVMNRGQNQAYENCCDSERHRLDIAFLFGIHTLVRKRNITDVKTMFLDEIMDISLDGAKQEIMFGLLKKMQRETASDIFVISHLQGLGEEVFDNVIDL